VPGIAWLKITDPGERPPPIPPDAELRVLLPEGDEFGVLAEEFSSMGAEVRRVRYLLEDEAIVSSRQAGEAVSRVCGLNKPFLATYTKVTGQAATAAREAFELMWHDYAPASESVAGTATPVEALVPADLARFLPFRALNQAQAEALPDILGHDQNLLVVAPTGAGKTVLGMAAALRAVVRQRRKAAWLVPQRSLTDELDRELEGWRQQGLRVERLSGEYAIDVELIRNADLWVSTTEKFEALCRTSALRESLAEVGVLIVDEIHMLGDATRGPVLEALLARIRDSETGTRMIGLSATVSNAPEVAEWLHAKLLRSSWRPRRLTWQLPVIPAHTDFAVTEAARVHLSSAITRLVTRDGGSVVIFCGSKRNVRRTALVVAAGRGVDISGVREDDAERLQQVCRMAGIGLHYHGWEHRKEAERAFRRRETDVLIATPTVAAGVNLPARAVIIQGTQVGLGTLDVATVLQMFGRAGRVGAGEGNGWAFMIVDERERAGWQAKLVAGHTVRSQILSSLSDHVLGEAVQQRITTSRDAEQWWVQTLAHHQGRRSARPLREAVGFLSSAQMLTMGTEGEHRLEATELGRLTARLMVPSVVCDNLRQALNRADVPATADEAEATLIRILAAMVPKLAQARVGDEGKAALARVLAPYGQGQRDLSGRPDKGPGRGDLAQAALLIAANSPEAFHPGVRHIAGIPYPALYQTLEEAPRYLHWLACQGLFGTIHPWCAIVAADLELRMSWRMLQPPRGSGRLLWACEQMATAARTAQGVPQLWKAARARGIGSPDWPRAGGRPTHCQLDDAGYVAFLRDRATDAAIEVGDGEVRAKAPAGSVLAVWSGSAYQVKPVKRGSAVAELPSSASGDRRSAQSGAAVFTWRDDYKATGWLAEYSRIQENNRNAERVRGGSLR
jgi:helicase